MDEVEVREPVEYLDEAVRKVFLPQRAQMIERLLNPVVRVRPA